MTVLAIETSCDETSAAVVRDREVLTNVVASQVAMHAEWGGVVPEAAARAHVEALLPVLTSALKGAPPLDAVAVTNRPGLVGALSVGVTAASAFALRHDLPLYAIHHLEGHLASVRAVAEPEWPMVALIASGGHTEIVRCDAWGDYRIVGETRDDAAGEAFDKAARLLGLGYPGGPAISRAAMSGRPRYSLPKGLSGDTVEFSFSGLKTAVLRLVENTPDLNVADAAFAVQEAIIGVLAERTLRAADREDARTVALVGGVAANARLREKLGEGSARDGRPFLVPPPDLCTDNAAMIGLAATARPHHPVRAPATTSYADLPSR